VIPFEAQDAARWCAGRLLQGAPETRFDAVSTDTRSLVAGSLFVAIRGPHHDAHDYLERALAAGAAGLLVEERAALPAGADLPVIAVKDTTAGLGALARGHRAPFQGPVVAITGSNGKTSTKEMCAAILGLLGPCLKNRGNLNNAYGLPLTLLERDARHRSLVVELGMNHRGEIAELAAIARPDIGVITNVGTAHIAHLGSREEIAREKGALVAALPASGTALLNADDPLVLACAAHTQARVVRFGLAASAEVRAVRVRELGAEGHAFELRAFGERRLVRIAGLGDHCVANALAAAAAAQTAGAGIDQVVEGLESWRALEGRMAQRPLAGGGVLIDDSYNANPQSMEAALRSLARLKGATPGIAVIGDMGELGECASGAHRAVGALAAELGLDFVFALGRFASEVAGGAREAGMDPTRIRIAESHEALAQAVQQQLGGADWVLVKGSRSMRMERVVEALAARAAPAAGEGT